MRMYLVKKREATNFGSLSVGPTSATLTASSGELKDTWCPLYFFLFVRERVVNNLEHVPHKYRCPYTGGANTYMH